MGRCWHPENIQAGEWVCEGTNIHCASHGSSSTEGLMSRIHTGAPENIPCILKGFSQEHPPPCSLPEGFLPLSHLHTQGLCTASWQLPALPFPLAHSSQGHGECPGSPVPVPCLQLQCPVCRSSALFAAPASLHWGGRSQGQCTDHRASPGDLRACRAEPGS